MVRVALAHDYGILLFDHGARIEACAIGAWLARDEIDIERYARLVRAARLKREQKQDIGKTLEATG
jgi:hypothetical protein